jgi:hypothetical protein
VRAGHLERGRGTVAWSWASVSVNRRSADARLLLIVSFLMPRSAVGSASMLPLLSSPFYAFFLSSILSLRSGFLSDARVLLTYRRRTHLRRHHHHCEAAESRDRPCPHPGLNTRSSRSHGLNPLSWRLPLALRPEVSNELLSVRACAPVTRYFMRLATPVGRPEEATPSTQRLAEQALHYHGLPPPASSARRDPVGLKLLPHFEGRSFR